MISTKKGKTQYCRKYYITISSRPYQIRIYSLKKGSNAPSWGMKRV